MRPDDGLEYVWWQFAAKPLEDDPQSISDWPGDVMFLPDLVERGIADILGQLHSLRFDQLDTI